MCPRTSASQAVARTEPQYLPHACFLHAQSRGVAYHSYFLGPVASHGVRTVPVPQLHYPLVCGHCHSGRHLCEGARVVAGGFACLLCLITAMRGCQLCFGPLRMTKWYYMGWSMCPRQHTRYGSSLGPCCGFGRFFNARRAAYAGCSRRCGVRRRTSPHYDAFLHHGMTAYLFKKVSDTCW